MAKLHALQKLLADHAHPKRTEVVPGEYLELEPDVFALGIMRDPQEVDLLEADLAELGVTDLPLRDKLVPFFDHTAPAHIPAAAEAHKRWRRFFRRYGLTVPDPGSGIAHVTLPEQGIVAPGVMVAVLDSHTPTLGAAGGFAASLAGATLSLLAIGRYWMDVPRVVRYDINRRAPRGVFGRDVSIYVNGQVGQRGALGKVIEFTGSYVEQLSMDSRWTLCNTSTEMGAMTSYIQPDRITLDWFRPRLRNGCKVYETDAGFEYDEVRSFDISKIEPQLAAPHAPDNAKPVSEVEGRPIDQAFVGSCANSRLEDLAIAAQIVKGRKVHPDCRFIVTPGSREVLRAALKLGYIEVLNDANAVITNPNCGCCATLHGGILGTGEVAVATNTRNFNGRMGPGAEIYLGSPATAAASALEGKIADPRKYLPRE